VSAAGGPLLVAAQPVRGTVTSMMLFSSLRRAPVRLFAVVLVVGALFAAAAPAAAQTVLATSPNDGQQLDAPPEQVEITLDGTVDTDDGALRLVDADGDDVALDAPQSTHSEGRTTVTAAVPPLADGWYATIWQADDGQRTGTFTFYVGDPVTAAGETAAPQNPTGPFVTAGHVLRGLTYLSTMLAIGLLGSAWALNGPRAQRQQLQLDQIARRWSAVFAVVGLLAAAATLLNNAIILNGGSFTNLGATTQLVLQSSGGTALLVRMSALFGLCTAVLLLAEKPTRLIGAAVGALASVALTVSFMMAGHAAIVPQETAAAVGVVSHLLAGAVWLGGVPGVALALLRRNQLSLRAIAELIHRFSKLATVSVVLVFIGGGIATVTMIGEPAQLVTTTYGLLLVAKIVLVGLIALVGAYNHFVLVPGLRAAAERCDEPDDSAQPAEDDIDTGQIGSSDSTGELVDTDTAATRSRLKSSLTVESVALILVLVGTTALTSYAPPSAGGDLAGVGHAHHGGASLESGDGGLSLADLDPTTELQPFEDGEIELYYMPGRADADNRIRLSFTDAAGAPYDVQQVVLEFAHPEIGLEGLRRTPQASAAGSWTLSTRDLGAAGTWTLTAQVMLEDDRVEQVEFDVDIDEAEDADEPAF